MRMIELEPFQDESGILFNGALAFRVDEKVLLMEGNGRILLTKDTMYEELRCKRIPREMVNVFDSRGFLSGMDGRILPCRSEKIIKPEFFMIDLTNRCNMRCSYCLRNVDGKDITITNKVLMDICQYIKQYCDEENLSHVSIQAWGGEPLLEKEKVLCLRDNICPKKTKVHISIETNATMLSPIIVQELYNKRIGIGISIDGMQEIHDRQRYMISGKSTYQIVSQNLQMAQKMYGYRLGTITTITKNNADKIEEILEHFAVDLNLKNVKFNFVHQSSFNKCDELCLESEKIAETQKRILKRLINLQERGYSIMEHNILVKLKNILFREYSDICLSCGCCGGRKMVVFDMEGNIYPCELTDNSNYKLGSIYDGRKLKKIILDSIQKKVSFFEEKKNTNCKKCFWKYFCQGGCTVRVFSNHKIPPEIDMIECAVNKALYPALIQLILEKPHIVNRIIGWDVLESDEK